MHMCSNTSYIFDESDEYKLDIQPDTCVINRSQDYQGNFLLFNLQTSRLFYTHNPPCTHQYVYYIYGSFHAKTPKKKLTISDLVPILIW